MKIVYICACGPFSDNFNYQENVLSKYHRKLGYDVTVITSNWCWNSKGEISSVDSKTYINKDDVKVIRLQFKKGRSFYYKFKALEGLQQTLNNEKPNLIFMHGVSSVDNKTVKKYLKENPNVKVYVDNHADFSNSATNWLSKNVLHKIIWRHYAQMIEPYTTKFYGVLPARVDFLKNVYKLPPEKCELLVMGADDELVEQAKSDKVRQEIRKQYNIAQEDFLIMFGGKIDKFKTQTLLLMDAVNELENKKVKLIVFGSVTEELKEQVNKRCSDRVQYIGWKQSQESYPLFAACDLACFPGRHSVFWEQVTGQGIPLLVKYWDGTTDIDLDGNAEFLFKDSKEEIKGKIEEIIKPAKYALMKKVAGEKGIRIFSYANIAKRSIEV